MKGRNSQKIQIVRESFVSAYWLAWRTYLFYAVAKEMPERSWPKLVIGARPEWSKIVRKFKQNPKMGVGHETFD